MKFVRRLAALVLVFSALGTSPSCATLIDLGPGAFTPLASVITFGEVSVGTVNPIYNFAGIPTLGNITVSFGGHFVGQAAGGGFPVTLVDPTPTGPLALDPAAPNTFTANDGASSTNPILSGTPLFNGPISILFSSPVAGVGLKGGFFNALNSTTIEAYDLNGNPLGSISNSTTGFEFYGLADSTGGSVIKGVSFYITGPEAAGFAIDNVTFGAGDVILSPVRDLSPVPEPSTVLLFGSGLAGLLAAYRRRTYKGQ